MKRVALVLMLVGACAPAANRTSAPAPAAKHAGPPDAGLADMTPAKGADVPSLDELAARGAVDAPGMREAKRLDRDDLMKPAEVEAVSADTCFRAVVAASAPVKAWFIDPTHVARGEIAETSAGAGTRSPALSTTVPPRGPVCAKKGETLRLVVHAPAAGTTARAVIWQSP